MAKKKQKAVDWGAIASFYAGRPTTVSYDLLNGLQGGTFGGGSFQLSPKIKKSLDDFLRYRNDIDKGPTLGSLGLATLLHESIHNRQIDPAKSGLRGASNEPQAYALGPELIGDLLQRFFNIPIDSKLSQRYQWAAKNNPSYETAYRDPERPTRFF